MPGADGEVRPLTAGEVARWEEDGYLLLEDQIPLEEIELTRRILRHDRDFLEAEIDQIDDEGRRARQSWRLWELPEGDVYAAFARHPAIVRRIEQLMGSRVFHYHHKMILKEKGTAGSWLFHQDYVRSRLPSAPPPATPPGSRCGCAGLLAQPVRAAAPGELHDRASPHLARERLPRGAARLSQGRPAGARPGGAAA